MKVKYILHGRDRDSIGIIDVELSNDGTTMEGSFSGTASNASGTVKGKKIQ